MATILRKRCSAAPADRVASAHSMLSKVKAVSCPTAVTASCHATLASCHHHHRHAWVFQHSTCPPRSPTHCHRHGVRCQAAPHYFVNLFGRSDPDPDFTVAKLQVAVFGQVEQFQQKLDQLAALLDTDDEDAMHELVQEVAIFLGRNLQYCAYAQSASFQTDDFDEAEQKFNQASMKERSKFKKETLINYGGRMDRDALREQGTDVGLDKWLCITLIVAAEAPLKLPKIRSTQDVQKALGLIGGLGLDDVVAVELLWTPQEEGDSYSKDELLHDYPSLVYL
eukprot:jgi/Chrzof1/2178/Cz11g05040.t1